MTQSVASSEQAVATLFAERQRYEAWLNALESKRGSTPQHIFDRVHADYTARLQRVMEQLGAHRAVLQELEANLMDRLTSLDIEESKHRDEASEAELRWMVGELPEDEYRTIQERADSAIASLSDERGRATEELSRLRSALEAGGGTAAQSPRRSSGPVHPQPAPQAAQSDWQLGFESPSAAAAPPAREEASVRERPRESGSPFDDLEFLKTVTDRTPSEQRATGSSAAATADRGPAGAGASSSAQPVQAAERATNAPASAQGSRVSTSTAEPAPSKTGRLNTPSYLKETGAEQAKTLKCQECGTLNYPTEWYCERCGAELAAL
jgi:hypothetical protein